MLLYYITDRSQFPGGESERRARLLDKIAEATRAGVNFIQLREKDLSPRELESLARDAVALVHETRNAKRETKLLINHRCDIALATGADGVHLRTGDISPSDARSILSRNEKLETRNRFIAVSCHTQTELALAEAHGADFAVFAPVFEKAGHSGAGLAALRKACTLAARTDPKVEGGIVHCMPVFALGGVTLENARSCMEAGAAGIAAIRLFQDNNVVDVVTRLRDLATSRHAGGQ